MLAVVITFSYLLLFDSNKCNNWTCNICWGGGNSPLSPSLVLSVIKLAQDQINRKKKQVTMCAWEMIDDVLWNDEPASFLYFLDKTINLWRKKRTKAL